MNKENQKRLTYLSLPIILLFFNQVLCAQSYEDSTHNGVNGVMRSHEKIYVVMVVCITILTVLFLYLIRIDRKVSKKEKTS